MYVPIDLIVALSPTAVLFCLWVLDR